MEKKQSIVFLFLLLLLAGIVIIFVLLKSNVHKSSVLTTTTSATTTTIKKEGNTHNYFSASLEQILFKQSFSYLNNESVYYDGYEFLIRCSSVYDNYCIDGSLSIAWGDDELKLFDTTEGNYFNNQNKLHVIIGRDKSIVVSKGLNHKIEFYDSDLNQTRVNDDLILTYFIDGVETSPLYPTIDQEGVYYYRCISGKVYVGKLEKNLSSEAVNVSEIQDGICK